MRSCWGRVIELAARMLSSIAGSLSAAVKGNAHLECLAELGQISEQLRGPHGVDQGDPADVSAMRADATWQVDALIGQLRMATELAAHATPAGLQEFQRHEAQQPWYLRVGGVVAMLRANLSLRSSVFRHAVRLAACVALADVLARSLHIGRTYWVAMTAAIVLKPDFTSTLNRGLLRLAGTFAGLTICHGPVRDPHSLPARAGGVDCGVHVRDALGGSRELWSAGNGAHRTRRADVRDDQRAP